MFQTGFARVDVTPPLGTYLSGYFNLRTSVGVLDPIYLNALAVTKDEDTVLVITGDFMYIAMSFMDQCRALIAADTGIPVDHIMLQSIHQHTSTYPGVDCANEREYTDLLIRKYRDVAKMALDDRKESRIFIGEKEVAKTISFIRRFRMKDGSSRTNPGHKHWDEVDHPLGEADNVTRLVRFKREGAKDIAFVNFSTHPDVVGGEKFSADWPGFVRTFTEQRLENVHCIIMNGCQGDTNHIDFSIERDTAPESRYAHSQMMGRVITDSVVELWDHLEEIPAGAVKGQVAIVRTPSNTDCMDKLEEYKALQQELTEGTREFHGTMADRADIRRVAAMDNLPLFQRVPVTVLSFGKVAIVGYGGEPFTEYAQNVRKANPHLFVLSACLANGSQGYLPSRSAFEEGGYEAHATNFTIGIADACQNKAQEFLSNV